MEEGGRTAVVVGGSAHDSTPASSVVLLMRLRLKREGMELLLEKKEEEAKKAKIEVEAAEEAVREQEALLAAARERNAHYLREALAGGGPVAAAAPVAARARGGGGYETDTSYSSSDEEHEGVRNARKLQRRARLKHHEVMREAYVYDSEPEWVGSEKLRAEVYETQKPLQLANRFAYHDTWSPIEHTYDIRYSPQTKERALKIARKKSCKIVARIMECCTMYIKRAVARARNIQGDDAAYGICLKSLSPDEANMVDDMLEGTAVQEVMHPPPRFEQRLFEFEPKYVCVWDQHQLPTRCSACLARIGKGALCTRTCDAHWAHLDCFLVASHIMADKDALDYYTQCMWRVTCAKDECVYEPSDDEYDEKEEEDF